MHTKHWRGAAGEAMTINSIVNSLTDYDYISKVKITVSGKPLAIEHIVADQPIGRNESIIQK
jgi:germination protein M